MEAIATEAITIEAIVIEGSYPMAIEAITIELKL